jgi:DNA-binding NtrC family response regulator
VILLVKKRVMIIDDEEGFALAIKIRLEQVGNYEVMVLTDVKDLINQAGCYFIGPDHAQGQRLACARYA